MKLSDLKPNWVSSGGEGITRDGQPVPERKGIGMTFDCPCGCDQRCFIPFENPLDGGLPTGIVENPHWQRTGDDFASLSLTPSILRSHPDSCQWHGFITDGEVLGV